MPTWNKRRMCEDCEFFALRKQKQEYAGIKYAGRGVCCLDRRTVYENTAACPVFEEKEEEWTKE